MTRTLFNTCAFIFIVFSIDSAASDDGCKTAYEQLAYLKSTSPIKEAEKLIALGKPKFLGTFGYTLEIPAVNDELYYSCYYNKIPAEGIKGTSDYIKYLCQAELENYAHSYAEVFNKRIVKHLKRTCFYCRRKNFKRS